MNEVITELNNLESHCKPSIARKYVVSRPTLSRRWKGFTNTRRQAVF